MDLPLIGESITRVAFDYAVTLMTDGGAELRLESAFAITGVDLLATQVSPADAVEHASLLVGLLSQEITGAVANHDGALDSRWVAEEPS